MNGYQIRMGRNPVFWLAASVAVAYALMPPQGDREYDFDEGLNLIKAALLARGFSLYGEIWSDQPPFFSWLLSLATHFGDPSLVRMRLVATAFSAVAFFCVTADLARLRGIRAALLGGVLLVVATGFLRYSHSLMIGLPSLVLAWGSLIAVRSLRSDEPPSRAQVKVILAAVLFGAALLTKLIAVAVLPAIVWEIWRNRGMRSFFLWGGTVVTVTAMFVAVITPALPSFFVAQLLGSHVESYSIFGSGALRRVSASIIRDLPFMLVAGVGVWLAGSKRGDLVAPLLWLFSGLLFVVTIRPFWPHHYLVVSLPLGWLAAFGVDSILERLQQNTALKWRVVGATLLLFVVSICVFRASRFPRMFARRGWQLDTEIVSTLSRERDDLTVMFTDRPIYAFLAGIPVPPNLAVISAKRERTGEITPSRVLREVKSHRPKLILLGRSPLLRRTMQPFLRREYDVLYQSKAGTVFRRKAGG